jgi:prevent-host-death family protein
MDKISLADAKARLSELLDRVETGAVIDITRRGAPIARLSPLPSARKPISPERLSALTGNLPPQSPDAANLVRSMRDGDRY